MDKTRDGKKETIVEYYSEKKKTRNIKVEKVNTIKKTERRNTNRQRLFYYYNKIRTILVLFLINIVMFNNF